MSILTSRNILAVIHRMPLGSWYLRKVGGHIMFTANSCLTSLLFFFLFCLTCLFYYNGEVICHKASLLMISLNMICILMIITSVNFSEFLKVHVCLILLVILDIKKRIQQLKQYCAFRLWISIYTE